MTTSTLRPNDADDSARWRVIRAHSLSQPFDIYTSL